MLAVDSVVQFFPRGGSAQVIRYLGHEFTSRGLVPKILCGSLGTRGQLSHAETFYEGLDVAAMDYTDAAVAFARGEASMDGHRAPMHPSYEDRGPTAPDRMFTAIAPPTVEHLIDAWDRHLTTHRQPRPDLVHLHHLSHLQVAVHRAYPGTPVITTFHGTDLKLLEQAHQATELARRLSTSLSALCDLPRPGAPAHPSAVQTLARRLDLTPEEGALLQAIDWSQWRHANAWIRAMSGYAEVTGRIVVVSETDCAAVHRLLQVPEQEITVVPNGVDTSRFVPQHLSDEQRLAHLRRWLVHDPKGWAPGQEPGSIRYSDDAVSAIRDTDGRLRPILLWVGRFQLVKRIAVLFEAFAEVCRRTDPVPVLLMWGGYPGEAEGEHPLTVARRLRIERNVFFIGWRGHDELPAGMSCADLMVAPAVNESFGMVYIEAQACGTPPIATNTGGPSTLITSHGSQADGWTVNPDDPVHLADTLVAALADPAERARRSHNGAARVHRRYSWSSVADIYEGIYHEAADRRVPSEVPGHRCRPCATN